MKFASILRSIIADFPKSLELAMLLSLRDFKGRYLGSKAGYFWAILTPLLYGVVFVLLRDRLAQEGVAIDTSGINAIVFAFFGVMLYQVWIDAVVTQCNHLRAAKSMMRNMAINPEIFALSGLILSILDLLVRIVLLLLLTLVLRVDVSAYAPMGLIAMVGVVLTGNLIGYLLALPASFFSDVVRFIQAISLGILLGSPIFYAATSDTGSVFYWAQVLNPLACTLTLARALVYGGDLIFLHASLIWIVILLVLSFLMAGLYRLATPLIMERL